jgi:hypothetical protein
MSGGTIHGHPISSSLKLPTAIRKAFSNSSTASVLLIDQKKSAYRAGLFHGWTDTQKPTELERFIH